MDETAIARLREIISRISPDSRARTQTDKSEVTSKYAPMFAPENLDRLTAEDFRSFLPVRNNRHWGNLIWHGNHMTAEMSRLREALRILLDENRPIGSRLDLLRPKGQDGMVRGLGRAVITAILQVKYPTKYGVLNSTTEKGMKALGLWPEFDQNASFGQRYERVNGVLVDAAQRAGVDLWMLDELWWRCLLDEGEQPAAVSAAMVECEIGLERYLHEILADNWERLELLKDWALLEEDGEIVGSHYPAGKVSDPGGKVGEIDLLAKHRSENKWLVIELKRGQSSDATVGQLLRYMGWVRRRLAWDDQEVSGLVICSAADMKMRYALECVPNVRCMTYEVSVSLSPVPSLE